MAPLLTYSMAEAQESTISDISIASNQDGLLLNFKVSDCFTPEMTKAIDNGISTSFNFLVRLYQGFSI